MAEVTQAASRRADEARWVTLGRASEILGVDESTLRRWADSGRLRVYRTPGGHRRFSLVNLEEILAGDTKHRGSDEIERLAVARIRRQLQRARQHEDVWYVSLTEANRQKLRDHGRRLIEMVGEYINKRSRRSGLLEEARQIGSAYGSVLIEAGLPLPSAISAYIGFRRTMDETTRQAALHEALPTEEALEACGQVQALGDQVLRGLVAAYESQSR
jgi:excisionase family DNA binding protein